MHTPLRYGDSHRQMDRYKYREPKEGKVKEEVKVELEAAAPPTITQL